MIHMLVRNRIEDYERWRSLFDAEAEPAAAYGLELSGVWREVGDPNNVFFMFEVESVERAQAFLDRPESAEVGKAAGVVDGDYHFVEDV